MVKKQAFGKKELKALYATYGEHDLYNSGDFNPNTRNLTTGAVHEGHHCERCKAPMSKGCFDNLHYAFCAERVIRKGIKERCGERFALRSDGCGKHRRVHGYNDALYRAADGDHVELHEFDEPNSENTDAKQENSEDDKAAELATVDEAAEAYIAKHGFLPATFHQDYFKQRAKEVAYSQAEKSRAPQGGLTESQGLTKGKPTGMKRNKRGTLMAEDGSRHDSGTKLNTDDGSAVQPKGKSRHGGKSSFAPNGAKSKKPMETSRRPDDEDTAPESTKKDGAKKFAGKVLGKMGGIPE